MVKVYVNGKNMGAESVQFSQLMFDQYNVCEYNDSNVIILLRRELYFTCGLRRQHRRDDREHRDKGREDRG